jgi:hypothetical protein
MKNAGVGTWIKDNTVGRIPFTNAWVDKKQRRVFQSSAIGQVAGMFGINKMSQLNSAIGSGAKMLGSAMQNSKSGFLQSLGKSLSGGKLNSDGSKSVSHPNGTETKINATQNNGSGNRQPLTANQLIYKANNKAHNSLNDTLAKTANNTSKTIASLLKDNADNKNGDLIRGLRDLREASQNHAGTLGGNLSKYETYWQNMVQNGKMTQAEYEAKVAQKKMSDSNLTLAQLIKTFSEPYWNYHAKYGPYSGKVIARGKRNPKTAYRLGLYLNPEYTRSNTAIGPNGELPGDDIPLDELRYRSNALSNRINRMHENALKNPKSYLKGAGVGAAAGGSISGIASALLSDRIKYQIQMRHPDWDERRINKTLNRIKFGITSSGTVLGAGAGALTTRRIINSNYNKARDRLVKSRGPWMIN